MSDALSSNTKAILLLTAPLVAGRDDRSTDLLTPSEYRKLARHLRERNAQPADFLTPTAGPLLGDCGTVIDRARLERLLARGFLLSQAVERWQARAIWVVSRADPTYPQRVKSRLREDSPAVLYGCGDRSILDSGGLAVVGSRNAEDALIEYTRGIGGLVASAGRTLVSGGARGIDQAAMRGALDAGGRATGVLADSLEKAVVHRENRNLLLENRLVLISPYDPSAGFNVGHAMQRNKVIYALADAALVVSADLNKGGTWSGATEQLDKLQLVPIYLRTGGEGSAGLEALARKGAEPWPDPVDAEGLNTILDRPPLPSGDSTRLRPSQLALIPSEEGTAAPPRDQTKAPMRRPAIVSEPRSHAPKLDVADHLLHTVRSAVVGILQEPRSAAEVARDLGVLPKQAEEWLRGFVDEGWVQKSKDPVRYSHRQTGLFGTEDT